MKFIIIIPAHNEEATIIKCLHSLVQQTYQNFDCAVVNDGSTDQTSILVENFIIDKPQFRQIVLDSSEHQPGAKVVRAFNKGLETVTLSHYDIVCKFDADIIFPANYLERLFNIYHSDERVGMASGLVYVKDEKNKFWVYENISSKNHVRGPIKSYRMNCFNAMKGLRAVLGWDNIDVMLAQMSGFKIKTDKKLWVKHLRPTAYKYKQQRAEKLGEYFYNIGLNFPLVVLSATKAAFKNRSFVEFFLIVSSFLRQSHPIVLTPDEINYIRKLRNPINKLRNLK